MEKIRVSTGSDKNPESIHWELQQWKSSLQFMQEEITFIKRLLDSYIFVPNTPNLFERLEDYKERLQQVSRRKQEVRHKISRHENTLGGMMEYSQRSWIPDFYRDHERLQVEVDQCYDRFRKLKAEIFMYAGGILKHRKP